MTISISNVAIRQSSSQLFNLNDLYKASGSNPTHQPSNWLRNQQTKDLIAEIEAEGGKACEVINGGKNRGTFVCKELVYAYATWISAKFFLLVIRTFDAVVSGSLKTKTALPNGLSLEQQDVVKAMHREILEQTPPEMRKALAIKLWASIKQKFGCTYKAVSPECFNEVISLMGRIAVENGIETLHGEVLDKQPETAAITFSQSELRELAVITYYCAWAMQILRDVATPLGALGYEKASTMRTLPMESRSFLRRIHKALTREMPKIASQFERADMQHSLSRCELFI